jgi:hypothetical protein
MAQSNKKDSTGLGIIGFILSLIGLIPVFGFLFALGGLICCIIQLSRKKTGLAIVGLLFSILGLLMMVMFLCTLFLWVVFGTIEEINHYKTGPCSNLSLSIDSVHSGDDSIVIRRTAGNQSLDSIRVLVDDWINMTVNASGFQEGGSLEVRGLGNLKKGQQIGLMPLLKSQTLCRPIAYTYVL